MTRLVFGVAQAVFCALLLFPAQAAAVSRDPLLEQAWTLVEQGSVDAAMDTFRQIYLSSHDPAVRAQALLDLADSYALLRNRLKDALKLYDQLLLEFPSRPGAERASLNGGVILFEMGRRSEAERRIRDFLARFPVDPRRSAAAYLMQRLSQHGGNAAHGSGKEPPVRVLLAEDFKVSLRLPKGGEAVRAQHRLALPAGEYEVRARGTDILLRGAILGPKTEVSPKGGAFVFNGRSYRGDALLSLVRGRVRVVNRVPVETYLAGVVPAEMRPWFQLQAFQAQAVASRTFALTMLRQSRSKAYDLTADAFSQRYKGMEGGNMLSRLAVASTRGQVLTWRGQLAPIFFHAHSGGVLEDDAVLWDREDLPFYRVRPDPRTQAFKPLWWRCRLTNEELSRAVSRIRHLRGGRILDVKPAVRSVSGRVVRFQVVTESGSVSVDANRLRLAVGSDRFKSTLCEVVRENGGFAFQGRGHGHGVGMSQWGAQAMSLDGAGCREILSFYYPGTELVRRY